MTLSKQTTTTQVYRVAHFYQHTEAATRNAATHHPPTPGGTQTRVGQITKLCISCTLQPVFFADPQFGGLGLGGRRSLSEGLTVLAGSS